MKEAVIRGIDISKSFDSGNCLVLDNVNFEIRESECVGFVGESGCGKSTLARIMTHLVKPSGGKMIYRDRDVTTLSRGQKRTYYKSVQMIFQDPLSTFSPKMTIKAYLMEPYINFKLARKEEALNQIVNMLESVKLPIDYLGKYPHELSGGELQRVVIARAVGMCPELIICDEATSALDVTIQKQIVNLLKTLQREKGFAMMFITHDLALAEQMCHRTYVMRDGQILEELVTDNLLTEAKHDYTKLFFEAGNLLGSKVAERVYLNDLTA